MKSYKTQRLVSLILRYILLTILAVVWIAPIIWIVLVSLSVNNVGFVSYFWPSQFTFDNYINILNNPQFPFVQWFINTLIISIVSCVLSTFITIAMSYALSRLRFKMRKPFLQVFLVLNMFPGFMTMIALYYVLKAMGLTNFVGLTLIYVSGAALAFYIAKGFFDTIPASIDEAAMIDGANKWQIFTRITIPLSRPIIVYTALMAFISPWIDYIFSSIILGGQGANNMTVPYGLYNMVTQAQTGNAVIYFTQFVAGCVLIAIPITILFVIMQKFYVNGITAGADKG
ncbi:MULTISPECIES: sugar ABC transporter permease [unclassified Lactococcus]|uniref:sugar ABC transporter permease n=1 Tax=unclassified Lactococcus TaxID=2643510 RepID=UPI0011CBF142|nr:MULTISPECIES: sugar ABC transporter permease [unclassified Lactococcus]MQW22489.1 ABC transporter permease subunit [Lactococcus sp. dk101]TXK45515.1 sugar ABC transporter permease [Lactococcus sp. dk310]TXK51366.1 sugar ABC transporter permease [Lactococcus sp. dk322]